MSYQPTQERLWHDTAEDALRGIVDAAGGPKRVGSELWPSKPIAEAARRLLHCLDSERDEKLSLDEIRWLLKKGRSVGCHTGATFLMRDSGYADPVPVSPEDERAALQREFIEAAKRQEQIFKRMEAMGMVK